MEAWRAATAGAAAFWMTRRGTPLLAAVLDGARLVRRRRRDGRVVPTAAGLGPVGAGVAAAAAADDDDRSVRRLYLPVLAGALAGVVDDAAVGGPRGWRAHWQSLRDGRPSTGILKAALIGLMVGAAASGGVRRRGAARSILTGASAVLAANALNQLDTGPGRAAGAFVAGYAAVGLMADPTRREGWLAALPLAAAVLGYWPHDRRGAVMMGDAGANALGAALGWVAGESLSLRRLVAWTATLLAVNGLLDRWSLSRWVELRRSALRARRPLAMAGPTAAHGQGVSPAGAKVPSALG
ncbi:hypothetical protein [Geochorda subterranea]|uniref:UDP-N-acetylmuramyl pentapeptide phosphotransferase/UDP-N-acetylglucosamine-1-phosphate transferase n=1 Tax=Geochorda subterranea TaxID=3109564 RepID=A0ABZ1BLH8_9FIRM|nr:hypothetical protein [Limnochorda sp. LNt]WRP13443.1 hypothetical protein VLY81_08250 [Limnochorda sp. LNt]